MNDFHQYISLQSYLNSLLISGIKYDFEGDNLIIKDFKIKINRNSLTAIKSYQLPILFQNCPTTFLHFVEETIKQLGQNLSQDQKKQFIDKITKSEHVQENIILTENLSSAFIQNEQNHYTGHYSHPYPKYKGSQLNNNDFIYAPELKNEFSLVWCLVKKEKIYYEQSSNDHHDYIKSLENMYFQSEDDFYYDREDYYLLPIHPHQFEFISSQLKDSDYKIVSREQKTKWKSTSSTRAIYQPTFNWMLKFSLSVTITNSVRHLQKTEIKRGILLKEVLDSSYGELIKKDAELSSLCILEEPFFYAIKNQQNEHIIESICILRKNEFPVDEGHYISQLASLNQEVDLSGEKRINALIKQIAHKENKEYNVVALKWFERFLEKAIGPIVLMQARYGIYLGAHQQNLILKLDQNLYPQNCYYRDCQGTGFDQSLRDKIGHVIKAFSIEQENVLEFSFLDHLINYYLFINSTYFSIFSIANGDLSLEKELLSITTKKLTIWFNDLRNKHKSLLELVLYQNTVYVKDNYSCCLYGINENTMKNPLDIYKKFINPFIHGTKMKLTRINSDEFNIRFTENEVIVTKLDKTINYQLYHSPDQITFNLDINDDFNLATTEGLFNQFKEINLINGVTRSQFYTKNGLWTLSSHLEEVCMVKSNEILHPKRPTMKEGEVLYRRYNQDIEAEITIRIIDRKLDLDIFHEWHNQERVAYFWELAKSKDELYQYISNGLNDPHQIPVIVSINNEAVGYFEIYWTPEDRLGPIYENHPYDRGFHLLIGNEKFLGFKNTDALLKAVCHYIFLDCKETQKIMGEPRADNSKILRYVDTFQAWRRVKIFDFPHKRAWLLECDREKFFTGNYL